MTDRRRGRKGEGDETREEEEQSGSGENRVNGAREYGQGMQEIRHTGEQ